MLAFAANSVLARRALDPAEIDAGSYTAVRLASGAVLLVLVLRWRSRTYRARLPDQARRPSQAWRPAWRSGNGWAALWLFLYAAGFSFAYLSLGAATGALILFGVVQATLMVAALLSGERPGRTFWLGFVLAAGGLAYLVAPGVSAPDPLGASLMAVAGLAWGLYTLRGRGARDPVAATAGNFVLAAPLAVVLWVVVVAAYGADLTPLGLALAVVSGAVTSGLGYVVWYAALPGLTAAQASVVQLTVAPLTALAGVLLLDEAVSGRLVVATVVILGGVALAIRARMDPGGQAVSDVPDAGTRETMRPVAPSERRS